MQFRLCNMVETDCSTYLTRVRAGSPMTQFEQTEAWSRQRDQLRQVVHNLRSRVQYEDSHGSSQASSSFPCRSTVHGPTSQFFPSAGNIHISLKLDVTACVMFVSLSLYYDVKFGGSHYYFSSPLSFFSEFLVSNDKGNGGEWWPGFKQ